MTHFAALFRRSTVPPPSSWVVHRQHYHHRGRRFPGEVWKNWITFGCAYSCHCLFYQVEVARGLSFAVASTTKICRLLLQQQWGIAIFYLQIACRDGTARRTGNILLNYRSSCCCRRRRAMIGERVRFSPQAMDAEEVEMKWVEVWM